VLEKLGSRVWLRQPNRKLLTTRTEVTLHKNMKEINNKSLIAKLIPKEINFTLVNARLTNRGNILAMYESDFGYTMSLEFNEDGGLTSDGLNVFNETIVGIRVHPKYYHKDDKPSK